MSFGAIYLIETTSSVKDYKHFCTGSENYVDVANGKTYLPLVINGGNSVEYLFSNATIKNSRNYSNGVTNIILNNNSSRLQDAGLYLQGRELRIFEYRNSIKTLKYYGRIVSVDVDSERVSLEVKSPMQYFRQEKALPLTYAGTNDGSTIYHEGAEDLGGTAKPLLLGDCSNANISPVLVDRANNIYQISCMPISSVENVYIGRAAQTAGTVYSSYSAFLTAAKAGVTAGTYISYIGDNIDPIDLSDPDNGAFIALGTTAEKPVTVNAIEGVQSETKGVSSALSTAYTYSGIDTSTNLRVYRELGVTLSKFQVFDAFTSVAGKNAFTTVFIKPVSGLDGARVSFICGSVSLIMNVNFNQREYTFSTTSGRGNFFIWYLQDEYEGYVAVSMMMDKLDVSGSGTAVDVKFLYDSAGTGLLSGYTDTYDGDVSENRGAIIPRMQVHYDTKEYNLSGSYTDLSFRTRGLFMPALPDTTGANVESPTSSLLFSYWNFIREAYFDKYSVSFQGFAPESILKTIIENQFVDDTAGIYLTSSADTVQDVFKRISDTFPFVFYEKLKLDFNNNVDIYPHLALLYPPQEINAYTPITEISSDLLLGKPKVKYLRTSDNDGGQPIKAATIYHTKNYTVMNETDLFGAAQQTDLPYVTQEYRKYEEPDADFTIAAANYNGFAAVSDVETLLVSEADAALRGDLERELFETPRVFIEVVVPRSIGDSLDLNDAVSVLSKTYILIGKTTYYPSTSSTETDSVVKLQLWG